MIKIKSSFSIIFKLNLSEALLLPFPGFAKIPRLYCVGQEATSKFIIIYIFKYVIVNHLGFETYAEWIKLRLKLHTSLSLKL